MRRLSPALIVALVALCSSLAGGAVAARLITSKDVKNGSLLAKDFKKGQLAAIKFARAGSGNFTLINSNGSTRVGSITIKAPGKGNVWLNYTATLGNDTPATWVDVFLTERGKRLNGVEWWEAGDADRNRDETQANQLVLPVKKGKHTYTLSLKMSAGTASVHDARMTALFVPASL